MKQSLQHEPLSTRKPNNITFPDETILTTRTPPPTRKPNNIAFPDETILTTRTPLNTKTYKKAKENMKAND